MEKEEELTQVPVSIDTGPVTFGDEPSNPIKILVVDLETTGFSLEKDEVIEVAGVMVTACRDTSRVWKIDPRFDFFREPKTAIISAFITELTGISPEDVKGQKVDNVVVYKAFEEADMIIAHNAPFDRPRMEKLLPGLLDNPKPWACSCFDPDWPSLGFTKRKLEQVVLESKHKFDSHKAINDCCAAAYMLYLYPEAMERVLVFGSTTTFTLKYTKNPWGSNDGLKSRGFAFGSGSWSKSYLDPQDMVNDRESLKEYFSSFSNVDKMRCKAEQYCPESRFSKAN